MTIKQRQWQLYYLGYLYDPELPVEKTVDGIWGPKSRAATVRFQQENNLNPDGVFGPSTENKTMEMVDAIQDIVSKYAPSPLDPKYWGLAGTKTMAATIWYQKAAGLTPNGIADAATRAAIQDTDAPEPQPEETVGESPEAGDFWAEVAPYITRREFRCKCGGKYCNGYPAEPREQLVRIAYQLRVNLGVPVTIVSGLRCPRWNAIQGGVANSQHMYGEAVDVYARGKTQAQVEAELDRIGGVRYHYRIAGSQNVHFDIPKGAR